LSEYKVELFSPAIVFDSTKNSFISNKRTIYI